MNKQQAIIVCLKLASMGVYAIPVYNPTYKDYMIRVNHTSESFGYSLPTVHNRVFIFQDCTFTKYDGMRTVDYPLFFSK